MVFIISYVYYSTTNFLYFYFTNRNLRIVCIMHNISLIVKIKMYHRMYNFIITFEYMSINNAAAAGYSSLDIAKYIPL
jgi:hypothetical protein